MSVRYVWKVILALLVLGIPAAKAVEVSKLVLPPPPEMTRADFYSIKTVPNPRAVLVICPGCNSSGEETIREEVWQKFAKENNLGLLGLHYESDMELLNDWKGYHFASKGSGQVLLDAVQKIYGKDLPLILYGVSSGAFFTCQFVSWCPERVLTWCSYAFGEAGEQSKLAAAPPGLLACGEYDGSRYGAALSYFKLGRSVGKPWLWVSLPKTEHEVSPPLEDFIREYFAAMLHPKKSDECWVDVDRKEVVPETEAERIPSISGWLPRQGLLKTWLKIHEP